MITAVVFTLERPHSGCLVLEKEWHFKFLFWCALWLQLGAPTIFSVLYSAISPALDPITSKKLAFIAKDSKITERLSEFFYDELVSWITTEVAQNNSKSTRKKKRYATPAIVGEPGFTTAEEAPYLRKDAVVDGHNIHGTQSFLQFLQSQDLAWQQAYYHVAP